MSNRTNGSMVREFEEEFAHYVGAKYAIACCNGTATLHTALVALGVKPGDRVAVPPLTMASTTLAVLHAGAVPEFWDVDPATWVATEYTFADARTQEAVALIPVSLYGLAPPHDARDGDVIDDAAETLRHHSGCAFTSYSFQASKILSAGEGGMLVTDNPALAAHARSFSRLGYPNGAIRDTWYIKHPDAKRHLMIGYNYRMADCQARLLLPQLERADEILAARRYSADCYRQAIDGCAWITPQYVPEGWPHSYWTFAIALRDKVMWEPFVQAIEEVGGERPYAAWRLTYNEPAFQHLVPDGLWRCDTCGLVQESNKLAGLLRCTHWGGACPGTAYPSGGCPVAEDLQPRLVQLQTNHDRAGSERAAECLKKAIASCGF